MLDKISYNRDGTESIEYHGIVTHVAINTRQDVLFVIEHGDNSYLFVIQSKQQIVQTLLSNGISGVSLDEPHSFMSKFRDNRIVIVLQHTPGMFETHGRGTKVEIFGPSRETVIEKLQTLDTMGNSFELF